MQILSYIATATLIGSGISKEELGNNEKKIRNLLSSFIELEYGIEIPEHTHKEMEMMTYYQTVVKPMKPRLERKQGKYSVTGLEKLMKPNIPKR